MHSLFQLAFPQLSLALHFSAGVDSEKTALFEKFSLEKQEHLINCAEGKCALTILKCRAQYLDYFYSVTG